MAPHGEKFTLNEPVVFRGRPMRVTGRVQFEGSSGQLTFRYQLSDADGAPVVLEKGEGHFALLRPFPPAARFKTADNTIIVGTAKYTLISVRRLKVLDISGNAAGIAAGAPLILSGIFEGLMGTLMREMVPGKPAQVYYLLKPLAAGEILSAAQYAANEDAKGHAAGERALNGD
ncbi:MAG: hypothetical protein EXR33_08100 [Betaproteobacteria bacterium]|nr:hypothetical protein [Betaproteobacteria bacterium]